jgi:hypothetical protein
LPFAVGAKATTPYPQVICLHGDGSFGQNAMELDTAMPRKLPLRLSAGYHPSTASRAFQSVEDAG